MKLNEALSVPSLDWEHYEAKAEAMTYEELSRARKDAFETAKVIGPDREGLYMDEMSVYAMEMARREGK